jgi:hypothetical protein
MATDGDRLLKCLEKYVELRKSVIRNAIYVSLASLFLAGYSRSPLWVVKDPNGVVQSGLHGGYAPIVGPLIIFALFGNLYLAIVELIRFRKSFFRSWEMAKKHEVDLNPAEKNLLELPFYVKAEIGGRSQQVAIAGRNLLFFGAPLLSYWFLLVDYFEFQRPNYAGSHWADLLLGTGGWAGFRPEHARYGGLPLPWIYPPEQTWLYLVCFALLVWLAVNAVIELRRQAPFPSDLSVSGSAPQPVVE